MKNPELVKAFKAAKRRIEQNSATYICFALEAAHDYGTIDWSVLDDARRLVEDRLLPYTTLESWLHNKHHIPYASSSAYLAKIKATRIAWLNSLIKEFS